MLKLTKEQQDRISDIFKTAIKPSSQGVGLIPRLKQHRDNTAIAALLFATLLASLMALSVAFTGISWLSLVLQSVAETLLSVGVQLTWVLVPAGAIYMAKPLIDNAIESRANKAVLVEKAEAVVVTEEKPDLSSEAVREKSVSFSQDLITEENEVPTSPKSESGLRNRMTSG